MAMFDVNTDDAIGLTAKLEKLHRSAFPVAVRSTLNNAAFETKQLIPKAAGRAFTIRQKKLYKKFIIVDKATGFDLNSMKAVVGIDGNAKNGKRVAKGLAAQETGGVVEGRKLIAMDQARISGSYGKKLKSKHRFSKINVASSKNRKPNSKYVLIKKQGGGTVFDVSRKKMKPVFTYRNTNKTRLNARPLLRPSARLAAKKMNKFYAINAEKQFKRLMK
ncbi:hypothetical protein [Tenacibaculum finnmarkense]|uniref:hypothetical protein n=1 Tax=Tenacibaculum finnmarkense TaxID=2781243 RepID=UPI0020797321|nr:hypothetical protein [Tenacibaculum finnmarkense]MCM8906783.1 hypothetical protein [Tenacibaculum finnmarkense genomovar finnmarkense]